MEIQVYYTIIIVIYFRFFVLMSNTASCQFYCQVWRFFQDFFLSWNRKATLKCQLEEKLQKTQSE